MQGRAGRHALGLNAGIGGDVGGAVDVEMVYVVALDGHQALLGRDFDDGVWHLTFVFVLLAFLVQKPCTVTGARASIGRGRRGRGLIGRLLNHVTVG